ncbi:MAG: type 2 isopentenyl-diphosphate Delta-isomerase [Peptococcaceae bacterium]|jgi:isopentenyl-diphosphate delta-isomerase|nr:type 2 isopentenyl-diphosphate Delta-isomerase [Peptococcaceae bacterium]MDH7525940.1 type 2 isopentenyl-diphosphate Delta-isomerase [Peptococcaceae bacterium]
MADEKQVREERKHAHVAHAVALGKGPLPAGWEDIYPVHQALLRHDLTEIDTGGTLFGKRLVLPLVINAMTGGAPGLEKINASLARVAREAGVALAVGSQAAGLANREIRHTYQVVREFNPDGLVMANVSAAAGPERAREAVEMIGADALQLHLNGAQELVMTEGDRKFRGLADNIARIVEKSDVPVMVKEVGFGISRETAGRLVKLGVAAIDVSGAGGTNFAAIELARNPRDNLDFMRFWGITAACSLLEVKSLGLPLEVVASGGISSSLDMMKALSLGANAVGIAGYFLKILAQKGEEALLLRIRQMQEELKMLLLMTGAGDIRSLAGIPLVITGFTRAWCEQRGIDTAKYAQR